MVNLKKFGILKMIVMQPMEPITLRGGDVSYIDNTKCSHSIENKTNMGAVSLHCYYYYSPGNYTPTLLLYTIDRRFVICFSQQLLNKCKISKSVLICENPTYKSVMSCEMKIIHNNS